MKSKTNNEFFPSKTLVNDIDPMVKLAASPDCDVNNSRSRYRTAKALLTRVGILLLFHILNVAVAIGGIISVVLMIASMALMPLWIAALVIIALAMGILHAVQMIPHKCLMYFGYMVLAVLYIASLSVNMYVTLGPYALLGGGAIGVGLLFLAVLMIKYLVKADVLLANFVNAKDAAKTLDPEECMGRFRVSESTDTSVALPHIRMTRRLWVAVLYFAVFKAAVAALSAISILFAVIQPALSIFTGDNTLFFVSQVNSDIAYVILVVLIWVVGAIGMPVAAAVSVKLTSRICGESESETDQALEQQDTETEIPVTPESESSATCFVGIESTPPVVASASV